ncbi:hypothetical protein T265_04841 [Opisthorchis viverrini]|uniref:Uncharacterized protein n=1 Tax=Opisthorchis viverrini TaxID=6198 RepID=A0A074ZR71_OPIVI|nr:hypothetical protein T265_04841 [Opisthorchis viverrini]KER28312.1 hypothetical protein T265_04841 [Opisthorchis viverrini]
MLPPAANLMDYSCVVQLTTLGSDTLLIRFPKTRREPMTGFALLGAQQVGEFPEFRSILCSTSTLKFLKNHKRGNQLGSSGVSRQNQIGVQMSAQSPSLRQPYVLLEPKLKKYTHLQINLVFTGDSIESLVYDVLQLRDSIESPVETKLICKRVYFSKAVEFTSNWRVRIAMKIPVRSSMTVW